MRRKQIKERLDKSCSICGKKMKVVLYDDKSYRGGHYFGKVPLHTKKELRESLRAGTITRKIGGLEMKVLRKDPKPYGHFEYWECPKCYWRH